MTTDIFVALWAFSCFLNLGFSIGTWMEGSWLSFLLSLLLVPLGPIAVAIQWMHFHKAQNENLCALARALGTQSQSADVSRY